MDSAAGALQRRLDSRERRRAWCCRTFAASPRRSDELLQPDAFATFRAATERMNNRAVFEIPDILEKIVG